MATPRCARKNFSDGLIMTQIDLGSLSLNVLVEGDAAAPALILLHPLGAHLRVWDGLAPALAEKFRVIRYDSRGHGGSSVPPGPYALADLGADLLGVMDALGVERAHLLGQSMGGAVAQWAMIAAPNRLGKVILANTAAQFPDPAGWNGRIRSARTRGMADLAPAVTQRWLTAPFRAAHPDSAASVEAMLRGCDPQAYAATCSALRDLDLRDAILRAPPRPVLVIVGDSDASSPPERGAALAAALPDARLATLKAAHLSSVEQQDAFLAAVAEFLG
jgi:3-oxoadipate enol-lactonase